MSSTPAQIGPTGSTTIGWVDGLAATWPRAILCYAIAAYICCFHALGSHAIISMEGMVIDGARHMLETGQWFVPHVYDEIYTFKPALAYWLSALPLSLFGDMPSELALRAPFALFITGCGAVILMLVGREISRLAGLLAAVGMIGTSLFTDKTRLAEFDCILAAAVSLAVVAACLNLARSKPSASLWALTYAALTAGFLAKGAPAVMAFLPGLLVAAFALNSWRELFRPAHLITGTLFTILSGGYLWLVFQNSGSSGFDQPLWEAAWRGFDWTAGKALVTLTKPLLIIGGFLPWSLLLVPAGRRAGRHDPKARAILAALAFLVGGTLAFMIVPTHEMRYYLPLAGSLALACGAAADTLRPRTTTARLLGGALGVLTALALAAAWVRNLDEPVVAAAALVAATLLAAVFMVVTYFRSQSNVVAGIVSLSLLIALLQAHVFVPARAANRARVDVAESFAPHTPKDAVIWVLGIADWAGKHSSLYYYLDRPVRTFYADRLPPTGSYVIAVDDQTSLLDELETETLIRVDSRDFTYHLMHIQPTPQRVLGQ